MLLYCTIDINMRFGGGTPHTIDGGIVLLWREPYDIAKQSKAYPPTLLYGSSDVSHPPVGFRLAGALGHGWSPATVINCPPK